MYTEQDDCSVKTSEESSDVFNVLLDNSGGKHKEYELDEQLEERGVDRNEQEGSKPGSYIYVVKQSPTNRFIGFLQRSKPVPNKWVHWFSTEIETSTYSDKICFWRNLQTIS